MSPLDVMRERFPLDLRSDVRFFAGQLGAGQYGHALALARAERWRRDEGMHVAWEPEPDPMYGDFDDVDAPQYCAVLYSLDGEVIESLGCVDAEPGEPYRRLVEAELAQEAHGHIGGRVSQALATAAAQLATTAEHLSQYTVDSSMVDDGCRALEECAQQLGALAHTLTNGGI